MEKTTGADGKAVFTSVGSGSHQVAASDSGYQSKSDTIQVSGDMSYTFNLVPSGVITDNTWLYAVAAIAVVAIILVVAIGR